MSSNPISLNFVQGDTLTLDVTWQDEETGNPMDLSDATVTSDVRKEFNTDVLASMAVEMTDAVNGEFRLTLAAADSKVFPIQRKSKITSLVFDINVLFSSGENLTPVYGYLKMHREVTA